MGWPEFRRQNYKGARQNLHRRSSGARQRQIVVCRRRARRLPSTGPTSAVNRPDDDKLSSVVDGPDVCRRRARRLPSSGPTMTNCHLPSTDPTSAVDGHDVCRQRARRWQIVICRRRTRRLPSTGPTNQIQAMSAVDRPIVITTAYVHNFCCK